MNHETDLILESAGLLSADGFERGDVLLHWEERVGWCLPLNHEILIELVREHLIPKLEQRLRYELIDTTRNPIRATTVNGQEVDCDADNGIELSPREVRIPLDVVLDVARPFGTPYETAYIWRNSRWEKNE